MHGEETDKDESGQTARTSVQCHVLYRAANCAYGVHTGVRLYVELWESKGHKLAAIMRG